MNVYYGTVTGVTVDGVTVSLGEILGDEEVLCAFAGSPRSIAGTTGPASAGTAHTHPVPADAMDGYAVGDLVAVVEVETSDPGDTWLLLTRIAPTGRQA